MQETTRTVIEADAEYDKNNSDGTADKSETK